MHSIYIDIWWYTFWLLELCPSDDRYKCVNSDAPLQLILENRVVALKIFKTIKCHSNRPERRSLKGITFMANCHWPGTSKKNRQKINNKKTCFLHHEDLNQQDFWWRHFQKKTPVLESIRVIHAGCAAATFFFFFFGASTFTQRKPTRGTFLAVGNKHPESGSVVSFLRIFPPAYGKLLCYE